MTVVDGCVLLGVVGSGVGLVVVGCVVMLLDVHDVLCSAQGGKLQSSPLSLGEVIEKLDSIVGHGCCLTSQDWEKKGFVPVSVDGSGDDGASKSVSKRFVKFKKRKLAEAAAAIPLLTEMGADVIAERLEQIQSFSIT